MDLPLDLPADGVQTPADDNSGSSPGVAAGRPSLRTRALLAGAVLAISVIGLVAYRVFTGSASNVPVPVSSEEQPLPTAIRPLRDVPFPSETVTYPSSWPNNLRYPTEFVLVETTSATLPSGGHGWGAKLRFDGAPHQAAQILSDALKSKGWTVASHDLDSGGVLIEVERTDGNSGGGTINIDAGDAQPATSNVLSTIEE